MSRLRRWWAWATRPAVPIWHHPSYRLPLTSVFGRTGLEPRRAALALTWLQGARVVSRGDVRTPPRAPMEWLLAVHSADWLESLTSPEELGRIFGVEAWDVPVDELLESMRLGVGGTVAAAREALRRRGPTVNTFGGFHHAGRAKGGGFCPVNDIAVAIAIARQEGVRGTLAVLDLDAHPPDGTADCLVDQPHTWLGSISGADWGPLPGEVDETVLPENTGDEAYLAALEGLLARMPPAALTFVIAGGDVVASDPLGALGLTEDGVRARDLRVAAALSGRPSVWTPGGGYGLDSWRRLALTLLALRLGPAAPPLPPEADPFADRLAAISARLDRAELGDDDEGWLSEDDLPGLFHPPRPRRLLDFYSPQGVELALARYGLLDELRRLGYDRFSVELARDGSGDRMRLHAQARGEPQQGRDFLLVELVLERQHAPALSAPDALGPAPGAPILFVHWMTLRHPLAAFRADRPPLPGQEVPGLGLAREASTLLVQVARRLELAAVAVRPAWFHVAHSARKVFRFCDPVAQGRFEAISRDLADVPLKTATQAIADGRLRVDGVPTAWDPALMVRMVPGPTPAAAAAWEARVAEVAAATTATLAPPAAAAG